MIILFFDLSAMEPDEIDHALTAAQNMWTSRWLRPTWWRSFPSETH